MSVGRAGGSPEYGRFDADEAAAPAAPAEDAPAADPAPPHLSFEQQVACDATTCRPRQIDEDTRADFGFVREQLARGNGGVNVFGSADGRVPGLQEGGLVSTFVHDHSDTMARTAIVHDFLTATCEPGTSGVDLMPVALKIAQSYDAAGGGDDGWDLVHRQLNAVLSDPDRYKVKDWTPVGIFADAARVGLELDGATRPG
jgi:hypothetical protein